METIKALWKLNLKLIPPGQIANENVPPSGKTQIPSRSQRQQKQQKPLTQTLCQVKDHDIKQDFSGTYDQPAKLRKSYNVYSNSPLIIISHALLFGFCAPWQ